MVQYSLNSMDYSDDRRSFKFEVRFDNGLTGTIGRREHEGLRDYSNKTNIVGQTIRETEELSRKFSSQQTEINPFLDDMNAFMKENDLTFDTAQFNSNLENHIKKQKKYQDNWSQSLHFEDMHRMMFQSMAIDDLFLAIGNELHSNKKKSIKASDKNFQYYTQSLSDEQKKACAEYYDSINQLSSKQRTSFYSSYQSAHQIFDILNNKSPLSPEQQKLVKPYEEYFAHINTLIKQHKNNINEIHKRWNAPYPTDDATQKQQERHIEELKCDFITNVIAAQNPKINKDLIRNIIFSKELIKFDTNIAMLEINKKQTELYEKGVQFDDLLRVVKIKATQDLIKFNFYQKTGKPEIFMDKTEADKFKTMSASDAVATYGKTVLSQYKSAALIMEALKRDKKQGKDIVDALNSLAEVMSYDKQFEKEFQPDGIKQFMFDTLIKDYDKFKPQGYKEALNILAQSFNHEYNPERKKVLDNKEKRSKEDISKKKSEVKARLTKRAEELQEGNVLNGTVVASKIADKIAQGYEVRDIEKVTKTESKKPLNEIQQTIIKKYSNKEK